MPGISEGVSWDITQLCQGMGQVHLMKETHCGIQNPKETTQVQTGQVGVGGG